jgi:crotonobetainyl-CoA:carnitine CoA-transferase CaiB-like acyl-CoA transferase
LLEAKLVQNTCTHWLSALSSAKVPCGPINDIKAVFEHPQIAARKTKISVTHPTLGNITQVANPVKFSGTPIDYQKAAPKLGEDTQSVLGARLGFSEEELGELKRLGVIG